MAQAEPAEDIGVAILRQSEHQRRQKRTLGELSVFHLAQPNMAYFAKSSSQLSVGGILAKSVR